MGVGRRASTLIDGVNGDVWAEFRGRKGILCGLCMYRGYRSGRERGREEGIGAVPVGVGAGLGRGFGLHAGMLAGILSSALGILL